MPESIPTAPERPPGPRARLRRQPSRGCYDREQINAILDAAPLCHIAMSGADGPVALPTLHARSEQQIYLHGSAAAGWVKLLQAGAPVCLTVTILDGLVFARSALHQSVNYRSAVVFGSGRAVTETIEQLYALQLITDKLMPGRWDEVRTPTAKELVRVGVVAIDIDEASAKTRIGDPVDEPEDHQLDVWAGVLPIAVAVQAPRSDPLLRAGIAPPSSLQAAQERLEAQTELGGLGTRRTDKA